jgi:hypothetical protein
MGITRLLVKDRPSNFDADAATYDAAKQRTRERIAELLVKAPFHVNDVYGNKQKQRTLVVLPGERWAFEQQYVHDHPDHFGQKVDDGRRVYTYFNGLEWSWPILERSVKWLPRNPHRPQNHMKNRVKQAKYGMISGDLYGFAANIARIINVHASSFMRIELDELKHEGRLDWFKRVFWANTGIWLDFTSPACDEVMISLINAGNCCRLVHEPVPFAVSMMIGRDTLKLVKKRSSLATRVHFVETCLNLNKHKTFEMEDAWTYRSVAGITMVNVTGWLNPRRH